MKRILIILALMLLCFSNATAKESYENITKIVIQPSFKSLKLNPGDSKSFIVNVKNPSNKNVSINAKVVQLPLANYINESWIEISNGSFILKPNEEKEIKITIKVPKNAEGGSYSCTIALTNDTISYPFLPFPMYVNTVSIYVNVLKQTIRVYPEFISDVVEPNKTYVYNITVENLGNESIRLNPSIYGEYDYLNKDIVEIDFPPIIPSKSKGVVKLEIKVPENAKGSLRGTIDLGIASIEDWKQRVSLNLQVFIKPKEPFVKEIEVKNASMLKITVSASCFKREADVDVKIRSPKGYIDVKPKIVERLGVDVINGDYTVNRYEKVKEYVIENPIDGIWAVEVMPKCTSFTVAVEFK